MGPIVVDAGETSADFNIGANAVSVPSTANISATTGPTTAYAQLTVLPVGIARFYSDPSTLYSGQTGVGYLVLSSPISQSMRVKLTSSNPNVLVPATVQITAGSAIRDIPNKDFAPSQYRRAQPSLRPVPSSSASTSVTICGDRYRIRSESKLDKGRKDCNWNDPVDRNGPVIPA